MTTDIIDALSGTDTSARPLPSLRHAAAETIRRTAFYLPSTGCPLFAWLHQSPREQTCHHGVIVCPPIGFEQLHAHRGLRHLADQLAGRQIPTLRFDWDGTGDSSGDDMDPDRFATWQANVRTAVRWMKTVRGCSRVSVVGLRLGATLAALALDDDEIDNLVLWAPVITGRSFVRELNVIDMLSEARSPDAKSTGVIEAAGFRLSPDTAAALSTCALFQSKPRCRRVLLVGRDEASPDQRLVDHFSGRGIAVEQQRLPGVAHMLVEPHKSQLPAAAIRAIAAWLHQRVVADEASIVVEQQQITVGAVAALPDHIDIPVADTVIRETACRLSQSPDLFGILSEPHDARADDLPTIVLLNAGAAYRIGPGRMTVEMARTVSAQGFRCLRLDLCGLGDSVPDEIAAENDSYAATAFRDIEIALQFLRDRTGSRRFVLLGLCSGAYAAFQSAAQLTDPDLIESILINPLTYFWRDGMTIETAPTRELICQHYYLGSALQPGKWLKLLSGRSHIGVRGALQLVAQRLGLARSSRAQATADADCSIHRIGAPCVSHPATEDLSADLRQVVAWQRHLSMFFATTDPGYRILTHHAGQQARRMARSGQLNLSFIDNADHTFSRSAARQNLIAALCEHLCRRYPSRGPT